MEIEMVFVEAEMLQSEIQMAFMEVKTLLQDTEITFAEMEILELGTELALIKIEIFQQETRIVEKGIQKLLIILKIQSIAKQGQDCEYDILATLIMLILYKKDASLRV